MGICLSSTRQTITARNDPQDCFDSLQQLSVILNERIQAENNSGDGSNDGDGTNDFGNEECIVVCEGREYSMKIKALCDSSSYFTAMFSCCMKESQSRRIELQDVDPETLEIILRFISHCELPEVEDVDLLFSILSLANMFLMNSLYEECCRLARGLMIVDNYQLFWEVSKLHETEVLSKTVIDFVAEHFLEVKAEVKRFLELEEVSTLLVLLKSKRYIGKEEVTSFIADWINMDEAEREQFSDVLYFFADAKQLELSDVRELLIVKQQYPKVIFNTLLEKFTMQRIKVFLVNRYYALWFHAVHDGKTIRLIVRTYRGKPEFICGTVNDHVYMFQRSVDSPLHVLDVLRVHVYNGDVERLQPLTNFASEVLAVVNNDTPYVVYKCFYRNSFKSVLEKYVMQYYESELQQWISIEMKTAYSIIRFLVTAEELLYVIGRDIKGRDIVEKYNTITGEWQLVKYPPKTEKETDEAATCCLGNLYLVRHPEVTDTIQWNLGSPKPTRVQKYENEGKFRVRYVSYCSQTDCEIVSKVIRFLKYNSQTDKWEELKTTGGPDSIALVLRVPHDDCVRIPYIYIIDNDNVLHQFDPLSCAWKVIYEFPRSFRSRQTNFPPLSCISY